MEKGVNVWKANLTNGLILGLIGIIYTLIMYFLDLYFNPVQGYVFIGLLVILVYFLLKTYRDNFLHGYMTYGQAIGAGMVMFLYYAIIIAIFIYILYTVIDADLMNKQLAFGEEKMMQKGLPQAQIDAGMAMQSKLAKPAIMAPVTILGTMFQGLLISLVVGIFVRKEGNPLIDSRETMNPI